MRGQAARAAAAAAGAGEEAVPRGGRRRDRMKDVYGIEPGVEHYGCVIDLLGRSGKIGRALDLISEPTGHISPAAKEGDGSDGPLPGHLLPLLLSQDPVSLRQIGRASCRERVYVLV